MPLVANCVFEVQAAFLPGAWAVIEGRGSHSLSQGWIGHYRTHGGTGTRRVRRQRGGSSPALLVVVVLILVAVAAYRDPKLATAIGAACAVGALLVVVMLV